MSLLLRSFSPGLTESGGGGIWPHHIMAVQLILFQRGGQIMPITTLLTPPTHTHTQLPNGVKVAVCDQSQKCQKLTKVDLTCSLQLY